MRVVSGTAKGRILKGPPTRGVEIRPALDKVKQAVFNILGMIEGAQVLDLFAGTGSIGIEALSRGAERALFVDTSPLSLKLVKENLIRCGLEEKGVTLKVRLPYELRIISRKTPPQGFDLIFVDPPYLRSLVNRTLRGIVKEKILAPHGTVIVEHSPKEPIDDDLKLAVVDQRKYGQTLITFLKEK